MKTSMFVAFALLATACAKDPSPTATTNVPVTPVDSSAASVTAVASSPAPVACAAPVAMAPSANASSLTIDQVPTKCTEVMHGGKSHPKVAATQAGADVKIAITDFRTYCESDAKYSASQSGGVIHVTGSKPTKVARCMCSTDLAFVVHGVTPGSYTVQFEQPDYGDNNSNGVLIVAQTSFTAQ